MIVKGILYSQFNKKRKYFETEILDNETLKFLKDGLKLSWEYRKKELYVKIAKQEFVNMEYLPFEYNEEYKYIGL